jgi:RNA polymerase sigma factor (sigma-70 family)
MRRAPPSWRDWANRTSLPEPEIGEFHHSSVTFGSLPRITAAETMEQSIYMTAEPRTEFAALLETHRRLIFKVAHTYAGRADVDDLAQEIAAQLWRAFPGYDRARRFSTWMYRIALNVAISWLRAEASHRQRSVPYDAEAHEPSVSDGFDADDGSRILRGFIDSQGPLDRAVLLLYLEERPLAEISEILGITVTNLTTKISRLKERLRSYAEKEHGTR